jgi:two-component system, cell cycle sensor histidine kinase and response regulator CckA
MNLFINASHAMPHGGVLTVAAAGQADFVEVTVSDTGEGIPAQNLTKIFDPFFTTKKEGEGIGLGLAICHSIVEHNGGVIRVRSRPGKGATFSVALPIDKGSRLRALKEQLAEGQEETSAEQGKSRILIVDDERDINNTLQDTLRAAGYEVEGAYDGVEGIDLLRRGGFDLVLLDIRMPRKDGLDVLKFIKSEYPGVKVIMVTGLASKEEIRETVNHGAFACIVKPFRLEKIMETVRKALGDTCGPAARR